MKRATRRKNISKKKRQSIKRGGKKRKLQKGGSDKIKYFHWWVTTEGKEEPTTGESNYFNTLLSGCIDRFDEVHVYTVFPLVNAGTAVAKSDKILTIQYSGEPVYSDATMFDINIIADNEAETDSVIVTPFMHLYMWLQNPDVSMYTLVRKQTKPQTKFCLFSVSSETKERTDFFHALSTYKSVDSCGSVLNNLEHTCPGAYDSKEYHEFISDYKFMICFENTVVKNYITEKLIIAYSSGTIPIYWGCPNIGDYVNMDAILYLKPDYTEEDVQALIAEVRALDEDEALYKKKFESIFFKDAIVPDAFDMDKLNASICAKIQAIKS
jgi:hypothetical protein